MITDILTYYPSNGQTVSLGLFQTPLADRPWTYHLAKSKYGVIKSQFTDAMTISLSEDLSLFDLFHGYCGAFAEFFYKEHPSWTIKELIRENDWNTCNHIFLTKEMPDGKILFADARGITDDPLIFFNDYSFSKNNMDIITMNSMTPDNKLDKKLMQACKTAHDIIFHNTDNMDLAKLL